MKKLILPTIVLIFSLPLFLFSIQKVNAQELPVKEITCNEAKKILTTAECPFWARKLSSIWCYKEEFKGATIEEAGVHIATIMSRSPSYTLDSDSCFEGTEEVQEGSGQQAQPGQTELNISEAKSQNSKSTNPLPVFIGEWFKIASELIRVQLGLSGFVDMYVEHRSPVDWPRGYLKKDPNDLSDLPKPWPDVQIKLPQQDNWSNLKQEDPIPPGSTISGPGPFKVDVEDATLLASGTSSSQTVITTPDPKDLAKYSYLREGGDSNFLPNIIYLQEGEIEILKKPNAGEGAIFGIETPNATVTVVHTHFLVAFDKKKNETTVAVYDGEVAVKSKNGKETTVTPNGDNPGVVVISQKLSPIKLAVAGLVLSAILGGVVVLLKRRFAAKRYNKKKR